MTFPQTVIVTLMPVACADCGCRFGVDETMRQRRLKDHKTFYCPNGHSNYYNGENEAERKAETAKAQLAAQKGKFTKYRNRIAKGVCPCCNLTFPDVAQHMASQHPGEGIAEPADYSPPESAKDKPLQLGDKIVWRDQLGTFVRYARNRIKTKTALVSINGYRSPAYKPVSEIARKEVV